MRMFRYSSILFLFLLLFFYPLGCSEKPGLNKILEYIDKGNTDKVKKIITQNQDLLNNFTDDGLPLLHYAVKAGQKKIVEYFIQSGLSVDIEDKEGYPPLFTSLAKKNTDITELLIKKGASLTFRYKDIVTPLLYASGEGNVEGAALLLEYGADVNEGLEYNNIITHPLGVAVENNNIPLAELFLDHGAEVNAYLSDKVSPLYRAVHNRNIDLVSLLVSRGADVNIENRGYDTTALILAAELGYNDIITYLLKNGAQISKTDRYSKTPLYVAAGEGHMETVKLLCSLGASKNDISKSLCSAA